MTIASVLLTTAMWAPAQQPTEPTTAQVDRRAMAEHVEVFREVLRRRLARTVNWGRPTAGQNSNYTEPSVAPLGLGQTQGYLTYFSNAAGVDPSVEGVYLSGYGVVFTTTLPTALRETRPGDDQPAPKALSDWERAQMELRGERPEPAGSSDSRPPSIRDVLLRVLADNGRHLTHLRENEKVAIVVTFRNSGGSWTQTTPFTALNPGAISVPHNIGRGWGMPAENSLVPSPSTDATTPAPTTARDYEILADLHLKQQQFQAAFDAYAKAIAAVDAEAKAGGGQPKDLSSLYARQAQALLGLGRIDAAKEALKKSEESKPIKPATPATREQRSTHVPARLIVSATKRQLDQVGQGQLSFEDFRKAAVIEVQ